MKNIYVGFLSKVVGSSMSIFYQDELMKEMKPDCIIHYITHSSWDKQYGVKYFEVLSKKYEHLIDPVDDCIQFMSNTNDQGSANSNNCIDYMTYDRREKKQLPSTYERHYLNTLRLVDEAGWIDGHENLKSHIITHLDKKIETMWAEEPVRMIFNIGGGNSLHQMVLSDIFYNQRLKSKVEYKAIYPDYHGSITVYSQNVSDGFIEIDTEEYEYKANISISDYLTLEGKLGRPDKDGKASDDIPVSDHKIYEANTTLAFTNDDEKISSAWDEIWKREKTRQNSNPETLFSSPEGRKSISQCLRSKYNDGYPTDDMIAKIENTLRTLKDNPSCFSFNKLFDQIKYEVKHDHTDSTHQVNQKKTGILAEEVVVYELRKFVKSRCLPNVKSIYHNIHITQDKTIQKEYDLVVQYYNMHLSIFDVKMRSQDEKSDESTRYKLTSSSSEYNKVSYILPINSVLSIEKQDQYIRDVVNLHLNSGRRIFFFELNNFEKEIHICKNSTTDKWYFNKASEATEDERLKSIGNIFTLFEAQTTCHPTNTHQPTKQK